MLNTPNNVVEVKHPLLQHKLSLMRDKKTRSVIFRALMKEAGMILGVEATKELKSYEKKYLYAIRRHECNFLKRTRASCRFYTKSG